MEEKINCSKNAEEALLEIRKFIAMYNKIFKILRNEKKL